MCDEHAAAPLEKKWPHIKYMSYAGHTTKASDYRTALCDIFFFQFETITYDHITRGIQYVMKTAQYIPKFYIYTLHNFFH